MNPGWQRISLGRIAPACSGAMPEQNCEVWNLSLEDIEGGTGIVKNRTYCRVNELGSTKCSFDARHVLYSKLRPYLNKVVLPDGPGVGTSELIPLLPDPDQLDREFLAYYLRSPTFLDFAQANTRGANLPRIAMSAFWSQEVPVPGSLREQRIIVARIKECMERVDEMQSLRYSSMKDQLHLSASVIESELHPSFVEEGGWQHLSIDRLVTATRNGRSISQDVEGRANGSVLTLTSVRDVTLSTEYKKPIELTDAVANQFDIDEGDVFVSRANTIDLVGLSAVAECIPQERLIYPDLLIKLTVDRTKILPRYLAYALRSAGARRQIKDRSLGASRTMVKISGERLREVTIPVPSITEQQQIIARLDAGHDLIRHLSNESLGINVGAIRPAILRKAFVGEL